MIESISMDTLKGDLSDHQIVEGIKNAKDEKFLRQLEKIFYTRFVNYVYKVAISKCRCFKNAEDLAKDVTQETFINAMKALKKFSFPANVKTEEHSYILKAWLGKIGNNCFRKIYAKMMIDNVVDNEIDEVDKTHCPLCYEKLIESQGKLSCTNGHYEEKKKLRSIAKVLNSDIFVPDFSEIFLGKSEIEIPNKFRAILQEAINTITDKNKHIIFTYASENCIDSKQHLSKGAMKDLCKTYNTNPENIRQIKKRTLDKIKNFCYSKDN